MKKSTGRNASLIWPHVALRDDSIDAAQCNFSPSVGTPRHIWPEYREQKRKKRAFRELTAYRRPCDLAASPIVSLALSCRHEHGAAVMLFFLLSAVIFAPPVEPLSSPHLPTVPRSFRSEWMGPNQGVTGATAAGEPAFPCEDDDPSLYSEGGPPLFAHSSFSRQKKTEDRKTLFANMLEKGP